MDLFLENWKKFLLEHAVNEAKDKKPDCVDGNKWHDTDGKYSTKEKATSWAAGYERAGDSACQAGKFKTRGSGKKLITKHKCGRDDDGVGKHPYKCKDGKPVDTQEEGIEQQDAAYIRGIISQELKRAVQQNMKARGCSFEQLIKALNMYAAAEKGELLGKEEK